MRMPYLAAVFLLLNLGDLLCTYLLIESSGGRVYESNPLAGDVLAEHGWFGLIVFKSAFTLGILVLAAIIAYYRPRTGRLVLLAGNVGLLVVVGYSVMLLVTRPWDDPHAEAALVTEAERVNDMRQSLGESKLYSQKLDQLTKDLVARKRTLPDATLELSRYLKQRNYDPLIALRARHAGFSDQACLGLVLMRHVAAHFRDQPVQGNRVLSGYQRQYERHFRMTIPPAAAVTIPTPEESTAGRAPEPPGAPRG